MGPVPALAQVRGPAFLNREQRLFILPKENLSLSSLFPPSQQNFIFPTTTSKLKSIYYSAMNKPSLATAVVSICKVNPNPFQDLVILHVRLETV